MKIELKKHPRIFTVGANNQIRIIDYGKIHLNADELVTFITDAGKQYDIVAKKWGFYATPSVNSRLKKEGFKTALVRNKAGKYFIMIVDNEKIKDFKQYLSSEKSEVEVWLDEF
jgi:hypothetical protein